MTPLLILGIVLAAILALPWVLTLAYRFGFAYMDYATWIVERFGPKEER